MLNFVATLSGMQLLWLCILLHLVADYCLQGCLADLKQKVWWQKQVYQYERSKYKYDHIAGLACHSLMWSLITYLPLLLICTDGVFAFIIIVNALVHARIDDLKANKFSFNLCEDQILHIVQIILTLLCAL